MIQRVVVALVVVGCVALAPFWASAQETDEADATQTPLTAGGEVAADAESPFDIELSGRKTWTIRTGFGSPLALATTALSPGSVMLDQSLSVDLSADALTVFRMEAEYNDQLPDVMQTLALYLDTEYVDGVLGDFTFDTVPGLTGYLKSMKGLHLEALLGDAVLTAVASRTEGIPETVVFDGGAAQAEVTFTRWLDDESGGDRAAYRRSIDGLYAYALEDVYSEAFSTLSFEFAPSAALRALFTSYEVSYLYDAVTADVELEMEAQDYLILDPDKQQLLLRRDPALIVRDRLDDLIDAYNEQEDLSGDDAKEYPFVEGTEYEAAFLAELVPFAQLVIDDVKYPIETGERRRFYLLGYSDVRAGSTVVEVSDDGSTFDSVASFSRAGYDVTIYEEPGVLECRFPEDFFTDVSVIRVSLDYQAAERVFMLGLSVIPGSEQVTLNGQVLRPDIDYLMDYEYGMLTLNREIGETDVLQVDYELYSSLGASSSYASNFYGLTLDWPVSDTLNLRANVLQLADVEASASNPDAVSTMPNRHSVAGIQAAFSLDDLTGDLLIGYNYDVFPFDDNARDAASNDIDAICSGDGYVLFGHHSGLTVYNDGVWKTYGVSSGLASYRVQAVALRDHVVYVGTDEGLTAIELEGASPFDRAANWSQLVRVDDLPSVSTTALLPVDDGIWIGTPEGLAWLPADEEPGSAGVSMVTDGGAEQLPAVTDLAYDEDGIIIGTEAGVYRRDSETGEMRIIAGTDASVVHDLLVAGDTLYVASSRGVRGFRDGRSMGWIVLGTPIAAVGMWGENLYYGSSDGLTLLGEEASTLFEGFVTTLAAGPNGLWVGGQSAITAGAHVWRVADRVTGFSETATDIPADNPYVFIDSSPSDHANSGWMSRATFEQRTDTYSIRGTAEWHPSTFRAIGTSSRSDRTGWTISGEVPLSDAGTLTLSHEYRLTGDDSEASTHRMDNDVHLSWTVDDGLRWTASLGYFEDSSGGVGTEMADRELSGSASVTQSFFRDTLSVSMSWNGDVKASETGFLSDSLSLSFDWDLDSSLRTSGSWSRPVRRSQTERVGSEQADWSIFWEPSLTFGGVRIVAVDVEYALDARRGLAESAFDWTHEGEVRFDITSFDMLRWTVAPDVKLWGDGSAAAVDLHGELVSKWTQNDWTIDTTVRGHLTELRRPVFYEEGEWKINVKYRGLDALDPSVTYNGSRETAVKGDETALTVSDSLTARVVWAPEDGPREDVTLSLVSEGDADARNLTATLDNRLTMNLSPVMLDWLEWGGDETSENTPYADLRVDTTGEYRTNNGSPDLSVSTTGTLLASLPPNWSVSFGMTYSLGMDSTIGWYHGVLLELTFAIDFRVPEPTATDAAAD